MGLERNEIPLFGCLDRIVVAMMYYDTKHERGKISIELPENTFNRLVEDFNKYLPDTNIKDFKYAGYTVSFNRYRSGK